MDDLLFSLNTVFPLLGMMAIGFAARRLGIIGESAARQINACVFKIFLPLLLCFNIVDTKLGASFDGRTLLYAFVTTLSCFGVLFFVTPRLCHDRASCGVLIQGIARSNYAIFGIPTRFKSEFVKRYDLFAADLKAEFRFREPNFKITLNEMPEVDQVLDARTQFGLVYSLVGVPNGVIAMSFAMPGLVETSTNLASVKFEGDNRIVVTSSQRSSVESAKTYVMQMVESVFALAGADVAHSDGYPGWAPNPQSVLLEKTVGAYERLFGAEPKVRAIHAGLECGLFLEKYPELEMVSFGPTLRGVHSPDERLEIATVPKFWDLLLEVLKTV